MFHGKTSLRDFNKTVFKYKLTFMKKNIYTTCNHADALKSYTKFTQSI